MPLLWYRAAMLKEKKVWLLLILFGYMLFLTHARTAQLIFVGELLLLIIFSLWGRYSDWGKALGTVLLATALSFGAYLYVPTLISSAKLVMQTMQSYQNQEAGPVAGKPRQSNKAQQKKAAASHTSQALERYVKQDLGSVIDVSKRSNTARLGNTVALFTIGMKNPIFGVGAGFASPYVADNIPSFAQNDKEIKHWVSMLHEQGFLESPIPLLNMFGVVICNYGIPGLLLFLAPLGMIGFCFFKNSRKFLKSGGAVCVLTALGGQVACLFSNTMFYTYPLVLAIALLLMQQILKEEKI